MFNKKLGMFGVLAAGLLVLGACGGNAGGSDTDPGTSGGGTGYDETVLTDNAHSAWVVAGNFLYSDGETVAEWNYNEKGVMTATSVADVATISEDVAEHLAGKNLRALYKYEGAVLGTSDAGWTTPAMKNGEVVTVNGSYAIKAIQCDYDSEEDLWNSTQWISDPNTAYAEAITPSTIFFPSWTEEADENGFAWNGNPVCIGGAGTYTVIVAQYSDAVNYPDTPNFGVALVKTAEGQEYVAPVVEEHTWGIIGSFDSWGADHVALTRDEGANSYSGNLTTVADDQWKIRADGAWTLSYGYESAGTIPEGAFADEGGNFKTVTAGTYKVTLVLDNVSAPTTASINIVAA